MPFRRNQAEDISRAKAGSPSSPGLAMTSARRGFRWWSCCALLTVGVGPLFAQLPVARLSSVFPPGGRINSTVEVSVAGADLDELNQLRFSQPNITASQKASQPADQAEANKFVVTIASNVPPGTYEVRAIGRFGVSNPRAFVVGDQLETIAPATNHAAAGATEIILGTVVNGRATPNAADYFKFAARKGQRLLAECSAQVIDSRLEPVLVLYDANGRELERNRRGGLLDFTPTQDAQLVLQTHDITFRGGEEYPYRLAITTGPHLDFILPPAGLPRARTNYTLFGRNLSGGKPAKDFALDGKPLEQLSVEIEMPAVATGRPHSGAIALGQPADAVLDGIEYRLTTPQGVSNPLFLSFATGPIVAEREPNDKPDAAQPLSLPCEVVGQFYPAGDQDWFTFTAAKGQVYWLEVFSQRLGVPASPFLVVQKVKQNPKGEEQVSDVQEIYSSDANFGGVEFKTTTRDPAWRFDVKEDATYRIRLRDLFDSGHSDPRHVYRLSLRAESPDFQLVALPQAPPPINKDKRELSPWSPLLRRGDTLPLKVLAFRRDNFDGDIQLSVEGLPPGVTCGGAKIDAGKNSALLFLTAAEEAQGWTGPVAVVGKAKVGDTEVVHEAQSGTLRWSVGDYNAEPVRARLAREVFLAVSHNEAAPVTIEMGEPKIWESTPTAKLQIPVKITRRGEFNANLKLKAAGFAALDSLKELEIDGKSTNATLVIDLAQQKVSPGTHTVYLQTQTAGKYRNNPEAAKAAEDAAKEAEKLAADLAAAAKKAVASLDETTKAAADADAIAKGAAEKLAAATSAAEAAPEKEELQSARKAAAKAAAEASANAQTAAQAKVAAEKASADASARAKDAEAKKAAAGSRAKEAVERAKPRDLTVTFYSAPITLKVAAAQGK